MYVREVVEEIQEKNKNFLTPTSILRKITQVRDRLLRNLGSGQQQTDVVCTAFDLIKDKKLYPLPAPAGAITAVTVNYRPDEYYSDTGYHEDRDRGWYTLQQKQFDESEGWRPYYYVVGGKIGLSHPTRMDVATGIKIFHKPIILPFKLQDLNGDIPTGFDPDFDMVLVYGVLKDITYGNEASEFQAKYQELYNEYVRANNGYETYQIKEKW